MTLPTTDWMPWSERSSLPGDPGIYLIAKDRPGAIIYVGKTNGDGGLRGRIRAFHRSATTGLKGHAGGVTFASLFGQITEDLFVSVHSAKVINPSSEILGAYLEYAERFFIWKHVEASGTIPTCNKY